MFLCGGLVLGSSLVQAIWRVVAGGRKECNPAGQPCTCPLLVSIMGTSASQSSDNEGLHQQQSPSLVCLSSPSYTVISASQQEPCTNPAIDWRIKWKGIIIDKIGDLQSLRFVPLLCVARCPVQPRPTMSQSQSQTSDTRHSSRVLRARQPERLVTDGELST